MSNFILNPALLSAVAASLSLDLETPGVSVGAMDCEPCKPFDGKLSNADAASLEAALSPRGVSVGQRTDGAGDPATGLIAMLGATPCRMWGEPVPGNCCNAAGDIDPYKAGRKICGAVAHYDVNITGAAQVYNLLPNSWFLPLIWQDTSHADTIVNSVAYQGKPIGPVPVVNIYPATQYPMSLHNLTLGMPAVSNTQGLRFTLSDASGTNDGTRYFRGKFIGISFETT